MLLADVAAASEAVGATRARKEKIGLLAACLRQASPEEAAVVASWLSGKTRQRRTGIGWASLRELPPPAEVATLSVGQVDAALERASGLSGSGSANTRRDLLAGLLTAATAPEQRLLRGLISGELRQGALAGLLVDGVAAAAAVPVADVRRAVTLAGDLPAVAAAALAGGAAALAAFRLGVGTPLSPMLAKPAPDLAAALDATGPAGVEWKLDGVRVQVHRQGDEVAVFTRTLDDITARLPEVVTAARALPGEAAVLDGEVLALTAAGRPAPFQVTSARVMTRAPVLNESGAAAAVPLSLTLFDALHVDGDDLIDLPGDARRARLETLAPELAVPRLVVPDAADPAGRAAATAFADDALARGHEGVIVKSSAAPYAMGRRGAGWVKVKPRITLDLVILAAEWGNGRRRGRLSNLWLGARDPEGEHGPPGGFVMLGKTFKGLTDAMLEWQTEHLTALAEDTSGYVVPVRPELVVEIAFDGVQSSPRYPAGMALRFARVLAHRPDKSAAEADTVATVRSHHVPADAAEDAEAVAAAESDG